MSEESNLLFFVKKHLSVNKPDRGISIVGALIGLTVSIMLISAVGKITTTFWKSFKYQSDMSEIVAQVSRINYLMESILDSEKSCKGPSTEGLIFRPTPSNSNAILRDLDSIDFGSGKLLSRSKKGVVEIKSITLHQDSPVIPSDPPAVHGSIKVVTQRNGSADDLSFSIPFLFEVRRLGSNYVFVECAKEMTISKLCLKLGKTFSNGWCN